MADELDKVRRGAASAADVCVRCAWSGALLAFLFFAGGPVFGQTNPPAAGNARDVVKVDPATDKLIQGALKWLAAQQSVNGSWGTAGEESKRRIAMTGYTLMAFLAAGQLPGEGEYGKNVTAGMEFLLEQVQPDGLLGNRDDGQYMYGHGIATIALAEIYGQTRSAAMKPKLEHLVRVIVGAQNKEGGWRYRPVAKDADISVTVLSLVAVRAAKNAGLEVPQSTINAGVNYVKRCRAKNSTGFGYQPGGSAGFARTSAAIYSLQVCGLYDDPLVKAGSDYLINAVETKKEYNEWFTYGNFYAAPAQYMIGGETWEKWYGYIKDILFNDVIQEGEIVHWDGRRDKGRDAGPIFCTAVYTLILAMPYHYIPLYQR